MELLLEFIFTLIFEGSIEVAKDRKISKWIRYPLIILLSVFFISVIGLIIYVSIGMILSKEHYSPLGGILLLAFVIILIVSAIRSIKKEIKSRKAN
ncbi:MAG: hypothetical protein IJV31_10420 [Clostridia bacterium]|nr:hypothetical protein [Clostridia bacterium]